MQATKPSAPSSSSHLDPTLVKLELALMRAMLPAVYDAEPSPNCPAAQANPAVARCVQAYNEAFEAVIREPGKQIRDARAAGRFAYRQALPPLNGRRNIRDFTACVAHGMLLEVIDTADGTRILYAAQVAANTRNAQPARTQKKMQKSAENREKSAVSAPQNCAQA